MAKQNGRKPPTQAKQETPRAPVPLTVELAIALANGSAVSTWELVRAQSAGDDDALPSGRFWYCGGKAPKSGKPHEHVATLAFLVEAHAGIGADSVYFAACDLVGCDRGKFADLPFECRLAFEVFTSNVPPLMREARVELAKREAAARREQAPPDRGVARRCGKRLKRRDRRSRWVRDAIAASQRAEAAE